MSKRFFVSVVCLLGVVLLIGGCSRGTLSKKPPVHLNPNMDWQPKYNPQTLSLPVPEGTVAWGTGRTSAASQAPNPQFVVEDTPFYTGKNANGSFVARIPIRITSALMTQGQERFNIYCAPCHDQAGTGKGMVVQRGFLPPPDLADARIVAYTDGDLFHIVTHGIRNMPAYGKQMPVQDRWAVVAYVRALQKMRSATLQDVNPAIRNQIR